MGGISKMSRLEVKRTILVTGGLGFIGSHFIERCLRLGHKIINIDKVTYASNLDLKFLGDYTFLQEDSSQIKEIPSCDFIINFAAESHVDNSISESINFLNSNIMGVYNLLEIIKNNKIKSALNAQGYRSPLFFQISTDEVFGDTEGGFFNEDDRHHSSNPYSATKSAAEQILFAWSRTYDIPFLMTRTTNNYGSRQHPEKLIPCAITKIIKGEKIPIHGDGSYVRNWIHVDDNVDAILKVLDVGELNNVYHIASEEEFSVNDIVTIICKEMGVSFEEFTDFSTDRSGADLRYALDYEKIKKIGWKQKRNLVKSLPGIVEYYKGKK